MAFLRLLLAGAMEICWAFTLGKSEGFSHLGWSIATLVILVISLYVLETVVEEFGVGMTYAVFTGIGTGGTALLGIFVFNETSNPMKLISLAVLLTGIVGLKLTTPKGGN
ncbi:DMT family transporter [Vagococcus acidifermentans]|uniref:QacE family quaternary ammonium compound efflux SMR transporter n=1 Tax=Vagococcus acidifermentans TaxID=564710 RepID=A0A430B328_9ENTE|nr:multidrug efflux SMR transporter [Vagococcus acidifermentans]RSU14740.1 QacE family quaternary ammonium compound efflux SMR transporter [Vagococcus acidifermentans]